MTKSFFNIPENYAVTFGEQSMGLIGDYMLQEKSERIHLAIKLPDAAGTSQSGASAGQPARNEKQLWRNEKRIAKFSSHIGLLPIVMVSPQDAILVNGSGEERRRFLNFILSQTDPLYLSNIQNYNALLAQRNKLLKDVGIAKLFERYGVNTNS